jgi:hypothetical protein
MAIYHFVFASIILGLSLPMLLSPAQFTVTLPYATSTTLNFTVQKTINRPVYLLYHLNGFYQNEKAYSESINRDQMYGKEIELTVVEKSCIKHFKGDYRLSRAGRAIQPT